MNKIENVLAWYFWVDARIKFIGVISRWLCRNVFECFSIWKISTKSLQIPITTRQKFRRKVSPGLYMNFGTLQSAKNFSVKTLSVFSIIQYRKIFYWNIFKKRSELCEIKMYNQREHILIRTKQSTFSISGWVADNSFSTNILFQTWKVLCWLSFLGHREKHLRVEII